MILDEAALRWQTKVTSEALRHGWNAYGQVLTNQRQRDPSMVFIRGDRVILAYLRSKRPRKPPPVERFAELPGAETYVWTPADWRQIERTFLGLNAPDQPPAPAA